MEGVGSGPKGDKATSVLERRGCTVTRTHVPTVGSPPCDYTLSLPALWNHPSLRNNFNGSVIYFIIIIIITIRYFVIHDHSINLLN